MRERGTGTIERFGNRFRARLPGRGPRLEAVDTREEALRMLAAALETVVDAPGPAGLTLGAWGQRAIGARELAGQRSARDYASVWRSHVLSCWLGNVELVALRRSDVVAWTKELATRRLQPGNKHSDKVKEKRASIRISRSTAQNALNLVRTVLDDALEDDLIEENPASGVKLPHAIRKRARSDKGWTWLDANEIVRLLSAPIPAFDRLAIAFSIGCGARQDEQWNIRWRDIDERAGTVELRKTKSGAPRTVPMPPLAIEAVRVWRTLARTTQADKLVWTAARGGRRYGEPRNWDKHLEAAELSAETRRDGRHVRWHDLRHTCGTSLIQGFYGTPWSREAVQEQLGHTNAKTTERYAHLTGTLASRSADAMRDRPTHLPTDPKARLAQVLEIIRAAPRRLERPTNGLGSRCTRRRSRAVSPSRGEIVGRALPGLARCVREMSKVWDSYDATLLAEDA